MCNRDEPQTLPTIIADVVLLSPAEGGRSAPLHLDQLAHYRPHIVIGEPGQRQARVSNGALTEEYLGVQFCRQDLTIAPGQAGRVRLQLVYYPSLQYRHALPGATFTVREGARVVGYGTIVERSRGPATEQ